MDKRTLKCVALSLTLGLCGLGCGESDDQCGDAGCLDGGITTDGGATGDGPMLWGLSRGMNNYKITGASSVNDGCKIGVAGLADGKTTLPVTFDVTTSMISIGDKKGTPPTPSLGSGVVNNNMATLTRENDTGTLPCTWHQKDVSTLTLTNHDKFSLSVQEDQTMFATGCPAADVPTGGKCTSTWTWTFELAK
jgi:hypothetical protein